MPAKILLADDNMTAQNMGRKILADAGYEVVAVSNGAAAMKKFAEQRFDLCLLDIFMPGYTGLEACEKIKAQSQTPVLLSVGKLDPYRAADGTRVGADGVLVKPFEATELVAAVDRLVRLPARAGRKSSPIKDEAAKEVAGKAPAPKPETAPLNIELLSPLVAQTASAAMIEPEPASVIASTTEKETSESSALLVMPAENAQHSAAEDDLQLLPMVDPFEELHSSFNDNGNNDDNDDNGIHKRASRWIAIPDDEEDLEPPARVEAPTARDLICNPPEPELAAPDLVAQDFAREPEPREGNSHSDEEEGGGSDWIVPGVVSSDNWIGSHDEEDEGHASSPASALPAVESSSATKAPPPNSGNGSHDPLHPAARQLLQIIPASLHDDLGPASTEVADAFERVLARYRDRLIDEVVRELENKNGKA
jgi:CheY-like chemotaxis protein